MHTTRPFTVLLAIALLSGISSNSNAQTITHVPLYTFHGDSVDDLFGDSVSGAGDVNGDGMADLIVGASIGGANNAGFARVLSGIDGSVLYQFDGDSAFDRFGTSVSGAGDVNGDGMADLIVGGNVYARVLSGSDGSVLYNLDSFGTSVSGAGDVNGDGLADLIVGNSGVNINGNLSGSASVLSGSDGSILYTFNGDDSGDFFGGSVSGAGDVNGDGTPDLIVGADGDENDDNNGSFSGSARVLSGSDASVLYTFEGNPGDFFGGSVSGAGDVNGDGRADLIIGANVDDNNGFNSGNARVFSGIDGSTLYSFDGDSAGDFLGSSVSCAGDVDGDGTPDLIVGAFGDDNNGDRSGSARVFSGIDGSILYTFNGDNADDEFGGSVSGTGDVNGDGIDDFIVGTRDGGGNDGGYARVFVSQISNPICVLGDVDLSGTANFLDIAPFIAVLSSGTYQCEADLNTDGMVSFLDIAHFIIFLAGS